MLLTLLLASSIANAPSVEEILERAIEVQRLHEEAGNEVKYNYELLSVTEKLDKNGTSKKSRSISSKAATSRTSLTSASSRKTESRSPKRS